MKVFYNIKVEYQNNFGITEIIINFCKIFKKIKYPLK